MGEGKTEREVNELNKILDKLPITSCGNPHHDSPNPNDLLANLVEGITLEGEKSESSPPVPSTQLFCSTLATSPMTDDALSFSGSLRLIRNRHMPYNTDQLKDYSLPDEPFVTSTVARLNAKDHMTIAAKSLRRFNDAGILNHTNQVEQKHTNLFKESLFPHPHLTELRNDVNSMALRSSVCNRFDLETNNLNRCNFLKLNDRIKMERVFSCQPLPQQINPPRIPSNIPFSEIEDAGRPYQQHYFSCLQSPLQLQQLGQSHTSLLNTKEEPYYGMHYKYMQLQKLQNQLFQGRNLVHGRGTAANSLGTWTVKQSYTDECSRHRDEPLCEEAWQNSSTNPMRINSSRYTSMNNIPCRYYAQGFCGRGESCPFLHGKKKISSYGLSHPQPAFSAEDFDPSQGITEPWKHNDSVKMLMTRKDLNSVQAIKFNSVGEDVSLKSFSPYARVFTNGHLHNDAPINQFHLDGWNFWGQSPEIKDDSQFHQRIRPHKLNLLDEIAGKIYLLAKDQYGCRLLQRKLKESSSEDIEKIFLEIVDHAVDLMTHPFGNYLLQRLLEVCNEDQRMQIVLRISENEGELVKISCHVHGTRVVQKVIETLKNPEQIYVVVSSMKAGIVDMIKDINGNHVAKRCLQYLKPEYLEFLFEAVTAHSAELATNCYGCHLLQKCLGHSDGEQRRHLMSGIISNALTISLDPFGNYSVKYVLELEIPWVLREVHNQLEGNYGYLSMHKYGSNVVETCLKYAAEEQYCRIIQELRSSQFEQIMQDQYGNYVIQTALKKAKGALRAALVESIRPHVPALRTSPYGKSVLSCIKVKK